MKKAKMFRTFIVSVFLILLFSITAIASDILEVHFIDVDQGDACLITCGDEVMLIDGGEANESWQVTSYLEDHGISSLDYVVATHEDEDHVGGLKDVIDDLKEPVGTVLAPYTRSSKDAFQNFRNAVNQNGGSITVPGKGSVYELGDAHFMILSDEGSNMVIRLWKDDSSFLFMGDANFDQEEEICNTDYTVYAGANHIDPADCTLESSVIKIGHHGSRTSTGYRLLNEVNPRYAVISVGLTNTHGHPTEDTLSRLRDQGAAVIRTDYNGDISFKTDGTTISYDPQHPVSQSQNLGPAWKPETEVPTESESESAHVISEGESESSSTVSKDEDESLPAESEAEKESPQAESEAEKESPQAESKSQNESGSGSVKQTFIINMRSRKFHLPSCSHVFDMKESNKGTVNKTLEEMLSDGYDPCKDCVLKKK